MLLNSNDLAAVEVKTTLRLCRDNLTAMVEAMLREGIIVESADGYVLNTNPTINHVTMLDAVRGLDFYIDRINAVLFED